MRGTTKRINPPLLLPNLAAFLDGHAVRITDGGGSGEVVRVGPADGVVLLVLVVAAYQVRPTYDIPMGTATDAPLLRGFNAGEVVPGDNGFKFRWSGAESQITLADVGNVAAYVASDKARSMTAATANVSCGALID